MSNKGVRLVTVISSGLILVVDQYLKLQALGVRDTPIQTNRYLGWQPFLNTGSAFSLPLPNQLVIALTVPMIVLVGYWCREEYRHGKLPLFFGLCLVLAGAFSNLADRMLYGYVVDYLMIGTGIINLADIIIGAGLLLILPHLKTSHLAEILKK